MIPEGGGEGGLSQGKMFENAEPCSQSENVKAGWAELAMSIL